MRNSLVRAIATALSTVALSLLPLWGTNLLARTDPCFIEFTLDGYYYAGGQWQSGWGTGTHTATMSYSACESVAQQFILDNGSNNCQNVAGIGSGTYGVGYVRMSWNSYYYGALMNTGGPVIQQYDCGDL